MACRTQHATPLVGTTRGAACVCIGSRLFLTLLLCLLWSLPCTADITAEADSAWQQGGRLMDAGKVFEGIRVLDSLRLAGFDDPTFLSDYSHRVFRAFVPGSADSSVAFLQDAASGAQTDSVFPDRISWKVTAHASAAYPVFQYGAAFTYRKPYKLVFPGLGNGNPAGGLLDAPEAAQQSPGEAVLRNEFADRTDAADCMVCMDLNDTKSPVMDYLARRISGVYDSIGIRNDLARYHAVSIRCFRRSWVYGRDGDFAAFVVFDRTLGDLLKARGIKPAAHSDAGKKIRFTVAMRSGIDIQVFTEAKLQSVLRAF